MLAQFDLTKQRQLADLQRKLAEKRSQREKSLKDKHEKEALQAGLPPAPTSKSVLLNCSGNSLIDGLVSH